ncbi:MAG: 16S rRNA (adenine(1518)-N(6)/adenine(1519)-N(6))-dimethyltransferase RsmA [Treponema sp.]|jgi:16S rRNA (adenine1518-N6/adenine1519-N6)-dimethyltransferase|nr:16S rRNA (adenine(1518)-N(6)/adenine(1519)-N(6))-dimethyltransferase RsmA [Treponema sp.]
MIKLNYNSASTLRIFLEEEGLGMRKQFGQNFLINPSARQALVEALDCEAGDEVWEIGPGLGAMTAMLLEKGLTVRAFEIDTGFIHTLKRIFAEEKGFFLIEGDVMKTWSVQKPAQFLLGNLPYNVAAAFLADLIEKGRLFTRMVVTVQKEVALRMTASAGSQGFSSFSVLCASAYRIKPLMLIRSSSFFPQPNVDSMGVLLENRRACAYPAVFYPLVRSLFASRRKTIKNNLTAFLASCSGKASQDICETLLRENGLTGNERAENLELEAFLSLAKSIENMRL